MRSYSPLLGANSSISDVSTTVVVPVVAAAAASAVTSTVITREGI